MRGSAGLFSYLSPEKYVPKAHPLRPIPERATLAQMSADFTRLYTSLGRALIPPEKPLRALLLQAFFGIRSQRRLIEQIAYNLLFRWFVGLSMAASV